MNALRSVTYLSVALAGFLWLAPAPGGPLAADLPSYSQATRLYDSGRVVEAAKIFRRLARAGNAMAQVSLAGILENGDLPTGRNMSEAASFYRKAARSGNPVAQMNLGEMLAEGRGVARDRVAAWVWLKRSAENGRSWAARRLERLEREMTPVERREGRARYRNRLQ